LQKERKKITTERKSQSYRKTINFFFKLKNKLDEKEKKSVDHSTMETFVS